MTKVQQSVLEINLQSLEKNFFHIKSLLSKKNTKLMAVLKDNGYGSDALVVSKKIKALDIDYFAVAYASEGVILRKAGVKTPVLVLLPQASSIEEIVKFNLEPSLYSFIILTKFLRFLKENDFKKYPVHVKLNTGLNRVGFGLDDLPDVISKILKSSNIVVRSIYSHLAASEDTS